MGGREGGWVSTQSEPPVSNEWVGEWVGVGGPLVLVGQYVCVEEGEEQVYVCGGGRKGSECGGGRWVCVEGEEFVCVSLW